MLLLVLVAAVTGCLQPNATFQWGIGTTEVAGSLRADGPGRLKDPLIVVFKHRYTFIPNYYPGTPEFTPPAGAGRAITHPTGHVVTVGESGEFAIAMPSNVVALTVFFMADGRLTDVSGFRRALGMGRIIYRARLKAMAGWRGHFYTFLEPQLQHLIVEKRYRISDRDLQLLGGWLDRRKAGLESGRATRPAPPSGQKTPSPALPLF